jgi:hypothetical protein
MVVNTNSTERLAQGGLMGKQREEERGKSKFQNSKSKENSNFKPWSSGFSTAAA